MGAGAGTGAGAGSGTGSGGGATGGGSGAGAAAGCSSAGGKRSCGSARSTGAGTSAAGASSRTAASRWRARRLFFLRGVRVSGNWLVTCIGTLDSGVFEKIAGGSEAALPGAPGSVMARLALAAAALLVAASGFCGRTTW
jgi:hypothetical protein